MFLIYIITLLLAHVSYGFERSKSLSAVPQAKKRMARSQPAFMIRNATSSNWKSESDFLVKPITISHIETEIISTDQKTALAYEAVLYNGYKIVCFSILEGQYAGEKWAMLYKNEQEPLAISGQNFDLIHRAYNSTPNLRLAPS